MKNKMLKAILINTIVCNLEVLSGCTVDIRAGVVKTDTDNNTQVVTSKAETSVKTPDYTKDSEKLLKYIEQMTEKIINSADGDSIIAVLEDYCKANSSSVSSVYFATVSGGFYISPTLEPPKDYDARTRTWYKQALENKAYATYYEDAVTGKTIVTGTKLISKNNENIGVMGIDKFIAR